MRRVAIALLLLALVPSDASDLVLIAHGSARNPGRRLAAHTHTETLRHRFGSARLGFLEEAPFAADVLRAARGDKVAVVGMFAGEGGHPSDDLPALLAHSPRLLWAGSIGAHPAMADLIADRATSAGRRLP